MTDRHTASEREDLPSSSFDLVGPYERHDVRINGRVVPYLTAIPVDGGRIDLVLDHRLGLVLTAEEAERIVPLLADAIAIGMGYTSFPSEGREPVRRHDFPTLTGLILSEGGETG